MIITLKIIFNLSCGWLFIMVLSTVIAMAVAGMNMAKHRTPLTSITCTHILHLDLQQSGWWEVCSLRVKM